MSKIEKSKDISTKVPAVIKYEDMDGISQMVHFHTACKKSDPLYPSLPKTLRNLYDDHKVKNLVKRFKKEGNTEILHINACLPGFQKRLDNYLSHALHGRGERIPRIPQHEVYRYMRACLVEG